MKLIENKTYTDRSIRSTFKKIADSQDEWTFTETMENCVSKFVLETPNWTIETKQSDVQYTIRLGQECAWSIEDYKANGFGGLLQCDVIVAKSKTTDDVYNIPNYKVLHNFLLKEELGIVNYI